MRPQAIARRIALSIHAPAESLRLTFDPNRIEQVLVNLLGNALKFTPEGGSVALTVRPGAHDVRIEVRDSGIGVEQDALPRLFDRFFQVDPSSTRQSSGIGPGLAITKARRGARGPDRRREPARRGQHFLVHPSRPFGGRRHRRASGRGGERPPLAIVPAG